MDRKRGLLNISVSIFFRFLILVTSVIARRYLIRYIGNEINGLDSLYVSILGFLSVAELGVGTAIVFCMYDPIVKHDNDKVAALYQLFTRVYWVIGGVIFLAGMAVLPFLPYMAKDYLQLDVNVYATFALTLVSVVLTYAFNSKLSLLNAYKNNYISTAISSTGVVLQYVLQIFVVRYTASYGWYLVCKILSVLFQWFLTEIIVNRKYRRIVEMPKRSVDRETGKLIVRNIKAMFMQRIGGILVDSTDSVIISSFLGVIILGKYSNYTMIATAVISIISLFFSPLTSIIGHLYVSDKASLRRYFDVFYFFNYAIGVVFFVGYYAVIDNLVELLLGPGLQMNRSVSFIVTLNYFIRFMRQSYLVFKDATGIFYEDRWRPLIEGVLNIILSLVFVFLFSRTLGEQFGVVGVIVATIITNLSVCHTMEPYVLYRKVFRKPAKRQILKNGILTLIFVFLLFIMDLIRRSSEDHFTEMIINGGLSLCISLTLTAVILITQRGLRVKILELIKRG